MHIGGHLGSELFQARQGDIGDGDVGTHAGSDAGGSFTNCSATQHQYLGGFHTRHTCHQFALSTCRLLQVIGTVLYSHTSCHLTHRNQQRQRAVFLLNRFVGDADGTTLHHRIRQRTVAGEMEIGE